MENKQISALVGVAPFCKDSGTMKGRRVVWGSRRASIQLLLAANSTFRSTVP